MFKKLILLIASLFIVSNAYAKDFGWFGKGKDLPNEVKKCFKNINKINGSYDDYSIDISGNKIKLKGKTNKVLNNCAVFVFDDAVVGATYFEPLDIDVKSVWYIKNDGVHIYGENGTHTTAMLYALSKIKHNKTLFLHDIAGSFDDDENIEAIYYIRGNEYNTVVPDNGKIYSGGTDFFLGGVKRTVATSNYEIGVHSWASGDGEQATDFPRDHENHKMFLELYFYLKIPTDFYWFTIENAPANGMYLLKGKELKKYNLIN